MDDMRTSSRAKKKPPYGPNIVRAWFDTVLNPGLRGLDRERSLLDRKSWTYRFYSDSLESIAPFAAHGVSRANLEQFTEFFAEVASRVGQHDECVESLRLACGNYHAAIMNDPGFREAVRQIEAEVPETIGGEFGSHFGAYSRHEDFLGVLAENLVNNFEELPDYYATYKLWNQFRQRLVAVLDASELARRRRETEAAGRKLFQVVDSLIDELRRIRSALSLEVDVPFAAETAGVQG